MSTEQQLQRSVDELANRIRAAVARELHELGQQWLASSAAELEAAIGEARRLWDMERAEAVAAEAARVRADAEQRLTVALAAARREADRTLESAVAAVKTEGERALASTVAAARAEFAETLTAQLAVARAEADERLRAEVQRVREEADRQLEDGLAAARADNERRLQEQTIQVRTEAERALESELRDVVGARASERQAVSDAFTRLVNGVRRLDAAPSLTDVLDALTERVATEGGRVALFIVQNQRVRGWRIAGFSELSDARAIDLSFHEAGVIGEAATTGEARSFHASADGKRPAGEPSFVQIPSNHNAVALPLRVGGQVMAVLYADDVPSGQDPVLMSWAEATEVLARHAGHTLEALTTARAAQAAGPRPARPSVPKPVPGPIAPPAPSAERAVESDSEDAARRYARLLLSEIKLYNEADVKRGREERDLFERLRPQIERARTLYEEKIPSTVKARTLYFEQELVRTLADGDPNLLGG